jgi:rhamnulokinase
MAKTVNLIAIDLGAESGRSILGSINESKLSLEEVHRFSNIPVRLPDGLHWDTLRLWNDIQDGISMAIQRSENEVTGLGLDTWGVDFGLLDRTGSLISNPFHYRDDRTDMKIDSAFRRMSKERIFDLTGIQFMQLNTLYQLLSMVEKKSPVLEIAETFLTMPDLFNFWLTGEMFSEFSITTTTQCYDPRRKQWSEPLLNAMGIPLRIFPKIIAPGTNLGNLRTEVIGRTGAKSVTVITPACHDTGSAVAAVPAEGNDFAWISSGTWSIMGINSPEPIINKGSLDFNFTNEGGVKGDFRFSKNIMGLWLVQECRRTWMSAGKDYSYSDLTELADTASSNSSVLDVDDIDFLKPGDMPTRIREYCQKTHQAIPESDGAVIRLALEGIALKYRWVLERLEELTNRSFPVIHIIGGGTKNQLLNQWTADATGRKVITGPVEATAIGNILTQAIALGYLNSWDEAQMVVKNSFETILYEPNNQSNWDESYNKLLELLK